RKLTFLLERRDLLLFRSKVCRLGLYAVGGAASEGFEVVGGVGGTYTVFPPNPAYGAPATKNIAFRRRANSPTPCKWHSFDGSPSPALYRWSSFGWGEHSRWIRTT
ncbi:unnamed protein product, partial [Ectocarpus sp. 4 AP-2014]